MLAHSSPVQHTIVVVVAVLATIGYGWRWLATGGSMLRLWCWVVGVIVLVASMSPWMETIAEESFTGHMVQHVLMIAVAAPLLVLAHPLATVVAYGSLPPGLRRATHATSRTWHRTAAVVAPVSFIGALVLTHLTNIYDEALRHQWVHELEHVAYFLTACALWTLMLAPGRRRAIDRVGSVFAVIAGMAFLGAILISADQPLIDTYAASNGVDDALDDQRVAASIMWVTGMIITVPLLLVTVWRWASLEQSTAERREALEHDSFS